VRWKPVILILMLSNVAFVPIAYVKTYDLCTLSRAHGYRPARAVDHEPNADVNLNKWHIVLPDPIHVPLTIDMAERMNVDLPEGVEMQGMIGLLSVYKDGRIMYDGKDLTRNIQDICNHDTSDTNTDAGAKQ